MTKEQEEKESMPISLRFRSGIRTDGELIAVTVTQNGKDILLTAKQALSLSETLSAKFGK